MTKATVMMATQALRSAADDLMKSDGLVHLNVGDIGRRICGELIDETAIRLKDVGMLVVLIASELEKENMP